MSVYVTKSMLSRLSNARHKHRSATDNGSGSSEDHGQKLFASSENATLSEGMICRVCAKTGCTPITDKIEGYDIISALESITNVCMNIDDSLPKYICTECLETLKLAINFKKTCESSDRNFKKLLNPMGDPSFHSYPYSKHDFQLILHKMKMKRKMQDEVRQRRVLKKERLEKKKSEQKFKKFRCSPCDIAFPNKEKLVAHRRDRQCMRRACELCGQLVISITQHMRHSHNDSIVHRCPTCNKEFPVIARLRNHMLVHTDTFNFYCDLCPYKCKHKYYLVLHMRTHTGEKPYKCAICPATFVNPSNLNKHKLTHQEKKFKCELCEKSFRTTCTLREHHDATHMNIKHTCNYCGRDFCYKSDLRKHEIKTHNRTKRQHVGSEPTYKQVERQQKLQDDVSDKWHEVQMQTQPTYQVVQAAYLDQTKEFIPAGAQIYFSEAHSLAAIIQQPQQVVQQQAVQLSMAELPTKKEGGTDSKLYEAAAQGLGFY